MTYPQLSHGNCIRIFTRHATKMSVAMIIPDDIAFDNSSC